MNIDEAKELCQDPCKSIVDLLSLPILLGERCDRYVGIYEIKYHLISKVKWTNKASETAVYWFPYTYWSPQGIKSSAYAFYSNAIQNQNCFISQKVITHKKVNERTSLCGITETGRTSTGDGGRTGLVGRVRSAGGGRSCPLSASRLGLFCITAWQIW